MKTPNFVSTKLDLIEVATRVLFEIDPANTYCNMNEDMDREYENEASLLVEYFVKENMMLKRAVFLAFDKQFGKGAYSEEKLNEAYRKINEYLV